MESGRYRPLRRAVGGAVMVMAMMVAGAARADAQQGPATMPVEPGAWTLTPWVGAGFGGDLEDGTLGVGVAVSYNWDSRVSFEGEFMSLPSAAVEVLPTIDTTVWNFTGSVLYHFAERPNMPYVGAGIGFGRGSTELEDDDPLLAVLGLDQSSTEFVFNVGGGLKRALSDTTSVRGDIRYFTGDGLVPSFLRLYVGIGLDLGVR